MFSDLLPVRWIGTTVLLECLLKLAEVLPFRPYYIVGRVIRDSICRLSKHWEGRCSEIFGKVWPVFKEDQLLPLTDEQKAKVKF